MRPHSEVVLDRCAQDALRLLHGECATLAEDVNELGELLASRLLESSLRRRCARTLQDCRDIRASTTCAPSSVGTTVPGHCCDASRIASSDFISAAKLRP